MMKKLALAATMMVAAPLMASADVSKEDIKKLAKAGISDDVILAFIRANGPVAKLSTDDVVDLKGAGVSDRVLGMMLNPEPKREAPAKTEYVERPRTTYVDTTPTYTYTYTQPVVYTYDYYYPAYYSCYPRYYYYSSCYPTYSYYPSYSFYYGRYGRCSSWGVGCGW